MDWFSSNAYLERKAEYLLGMPESVIEPGRFYHALRGLLPMSADSSYA